MILELAGLSLEVSGLSGPLLASARRRYARFVGRRAPEMVLELRTERDGEQRPTAMPQVERTGPRRFAVEYGALSADLDLATGRCRAELPSGIYVVDSLLRIAVGLILAERGGLLLHGSGVLVDGGALVCFGPSGVGKTTVARSVAREQVLCDEMIALLPSKDGFYVHGTPFHGDYRECAPGSAPLFALVRLVQGAEDRLERLSPAAAAQALLGSTLFFCRDEALAEALLSAAIEVCAQGTYRLTFQRGTHVPTFIGGKLGRRTAAGAVAQAARSRAER
jgi:hypothetical protein